MRKSMFVSLLHNILGPLFGGNLSSFLTIIKIWKTVKTWMVPVLWKISYQTAHIFQYSTGVSHNDLVGSRSKVTVIVMNKFVLYLSNGSEWFHHMLVLGVWLCQVIRKYGLLEYCMQVNTSNFWGASFFHISFQ